MTTPFDERGEVDIAAAQARWLLEAGVHGLAAGGVAQSSSGRPSQS